MNQFDVIQYMQQHGIATISVSQNKEKLSLYQKLTDGRMIATHITQQIREPKSKI